MYVIKNQMKTFLIDLDISNIFYYTYTMNIIRQLILVITFLSAISALISISSTASASIDYSDTSIEEVFKVIVTVAGVEGHCGEELTITVADKSETYELCEGDERPSEEQIADPIASIGYQFEFPKGQVEVGESFDVCVEVSHGFSDCKTLTNSPSKQPEEVTFSID
jgi:hypothetical protein